MRVIILDAFHISYAFSWSKLFITLFDRDNLSYCTQSVTVTALGDSVSGFGVLLGQGQYAFYKKLVNFIQVMAYNLFSSSLYESKDICDQNAKYV